jgi:hypothetical protein
MDLAICGLGRGPLGQPASPPDTSPVLCGSGEDLILTREAREGEEAAANELAAATNRPKRA